MAGSSRAMTLRLVRATALVVGILASTAGIAYVISAVTQPQIVWLLDGPGNVSGLVTLPLELRIAHAATVLAACATVAALAFILAGLARRVREGVAFVPAISGAAWALAIVLAAGSWLAQIGENVAVRSGVAYPDTGDVTTMDPATLPLRWEFGPATVLPDLPYLGLAVVLAILASIIHAGERLQRETEGLV
jgi:hypothetical protein